MNSTSLPTKLFRVPHTEGITIWPLKRLRTRLSIPFGFLQLEGTRMKRSDWCLNHDFLSTQIHPLTPFLHRCGSFELEIERNHIRFLTMGIWRAFFKKLACFLTIIEYLVLREESLRKISLRIVANNHHQQHNPQINPSYSLLNSAVGINIPAATILADFVELVVVDCRKSRRRTS